MDRRLAEAWTAVLAVAVALLSVLVAGGTLASWDRSLLAATQAPASAPLDWVMFVVSLGGAVEVTIPLLAVTCLLTPGLPPLDWRRWLPVAVAAALVLLELLAKHGVAETPPPMQLHRGPTFGVGVATPYSFPSGHMIRGTMAWGILGLRAFGRRGDVRWIVLAAALLALLGFSRIYLGEHWPADVAGGLLLGAAGLTLCLATAPASLLGRAPTPHPPEGGAGRASPGVGPQGFILR